MTNDNFFSFFMGGFECSYHKTFHKRFDILADTLHEKFCLEDYNLLKERGIYTVREGLSWNYIDKDIGKYTFDRYEILMEAGAKNNIQQIWDLNHFDYPEDLDPFSDNFIERFVNYAKAVIDTLRKYSTNTLYIVPFNEISFFSWIAGEIGAWAPFIREQGFQLKIQCVKAVIAAIKAIKKIDQNVKFIHTDPIMHRIPKHTNNPLVCEYVKEFQEIRYQTWDMLAGKIFPHLGGDIKYLDFIGINYYLHNQEYVFDVIKTENIFSSIICETIPFNSQNRVSFEKLCKDVYTRYKLPILITETGCYGDLRYRWWLNILLECQILLKKQIPLKGICAYPVIDRHDWDTGILTHSGLWDFIPGDINLSRYPHHISLNLIEKFQRKYLMENYENM